MRVGYRIFIAYFLLVVTGGYLLFDRFRQEAKPLVQQSVEDLMVDSANLLAEFVSYDALSNELATDDLGVAINGLKNRQLNATIWSQLKKQSNVRVYVTDQQGIVVFDSDGTAVGADYSQWNDVYLTLRGEYGARSTRAVTSRDRRRGNADENSGNSVMYVAAPILHTNKIVGVLTLVKPNDSLQPFFKRSYQKMRNHALLVAMVSLALGMLLISHFSQSVNKLLNYVQAISNGERSSPPKLSTQELNGLGLAVDDMRRQLEGKEYVENYIHSLTHELKSPLTTLQGAAELLEADLPPADQQKFVSRIHQQTDRIKILIDKMLSLASLEKMRELENPVEADVRQIIERSVDGLREHINAKELSVNIDGVRSANVKCDPFLLGLAIDNLIKNAIDFCAKQQTIEIITAEQSGQLEIQVIDSGTGIPAYAQDRLFERFYSLERPDTQQKSTGLGLAFVREIATLHGGGVRLVNRSEQGCIASLSIRI